MLLPFPNFLAVCSPGDAAQMMVLKKARKFSPTQQTREQLLEEKPRNQSIISKCNVNKNI